MKINNTAVNSSPGEYINLADQITAWIRDYAQNAGISTLVVGISGGIDSAVVSALCARTQMPTIAVGMPIQSKPHLTRLSDLQGQWLTDGFSNVRHVIIDQTRTFETFQTTMAADGFDSELAFANNRSRQRMMTLYQIAQSTHGLVVGTGNRVEDFGVGFFTKYGDGGVDISPIAGLMKTEVWTLGQVLGIDAEIINAAPTDGLWADGRVDQDQLGGLSYPELEQAMILDESGVALNSLTMADQQLLNAYRAIRARNMHKMLPIPVFQKDQ
jgi:NAD+ synthase